MTGVEAGGGVGGRSVVNLLLFARVCAWRESRSDALESVY
jgi:hypothetical protein